LPPTDRLDDLARLLGATPAELRALATARDRVEEHHRARPPSVPPPAGAPGVVVPRQLPAPLRLFTGRADALDWLDAQLWDETAESGVVVATIDGMAGVGKTALAVFWAHQTRSGSGPASSM
jgi:hypothetical protein